MSTQQFGSFFLPGPTEVRGEVLAAMLKPMIPHRSVEFEELFARLQAGLKDVFLTARPVFIAAASGTGMMEAAIRALPPGRLLCLVNGAFSERFAHIAEMCGRHVDRYEMPWGAIHSARELDNYLRPRPYVAITATHSETSTGALNAIRELSDAAHARGALCMIDSVSALGGAELRFDEWGLDYVLTGSQKALALPPGLALAVASEEVIRLAENAEQRGVYFDLVEMSRYASSNQVPATPAFSLLYALEVQLKAIAREGIEERWLRHSRMAGATDSWVERMQAMDVGIENIVPKGARSPTVSTIRLPAAMNGKDFVKKVKALGIQVGGGYGKLADTTFRIGHMGDHDVGTLQACFDACEAVLTA
ncbi:MAG TPA: alanine--glyoxylate aminotransferase family protein [Gemmatimonadaceae bacterium]|nr:alanine--glyoxylate aminotransferase family protein [Gemmatimonadaceae bacterium]